MSNSLRETLSAYDRQMELSDGRKLGYADYGDPNGRRIMYFHGGLSSRLDGAWMQDAAWSARTRVIAVDRPGMGLSERKQGRNLIDFPDDVRQLAAKLNMTKFGIMGWSCGAYYALACANRLEDLITRVALVGALAPPDKETVRSLGMLEDRILFDWPPFLNSFLADAIAAMRMMSPASLRKQMLDKLKSPADIETIKKLTAEQVAGVFYESVRVSGNGITDDYLACRLPWKFDLASINVPVTLWHGAEDNIVPVENSRRLAAKMPKVAKVVELPGQGHFLLARNAEPILHALVQR